MPTSMWVFRVQTKRRLDAHIHVRVRSSSGPRWPAPRDLTALLSLKSVEFQKRYSNSDAFDIRTFLSFWRTYVLFKIKFTYDNVLGTNKTRKKVARVIVTRISPLPCRCVQQSLTEIPKYDCIKKRLIPLELSIQLSAKLDNNTTKVRIMVASPQISTIATTQNQARSNVV